MENQYVIRSINSTRKNKLFVQLLTDFKIDEQTIASAFKKYYIGTDENYNPVFWQMNESFHLFNGTVNHIPVWNETEFTPAIFGGHLLRYYTNETICITNTAEEALVYDIYFPGRIWISCKTTNTLQTLPAAAKIIIFENKDSQWSRYLNNFLKSIHRNSSILQSKISLQSLKDAGPYEMQIVKPNFQKYAPGKHREHKSLKTAYQQTLANEQFQAFAKELNLTIESIELIEK